MKGLSSIVKSKESGATANTNGGGSTASAAAAPPSAPKVPKEGNGKHGLISKITSRASLKSKNTKSGTFEHGAEAPLPTLVSSKADELTRAFNVFDADKDGRVSTAELRSVLTSLGGAISEEELVDIMKEVDMDNDGFISLHEFIGFHKSGARALVTGDEVSPVPDPMKDAFQTFDKDGDKRISATELQSVLVSLGEKGHSLEECRQMIGGVDKDGDGHVDFSEFQELMGGQQ
ncbi:calmodulin-like protein 3 [Physcomitrium patens]|uniref:EF-hand domain-containing protein n=1 Tax=Physcomitrium patens TaxID=3218 RepID=A0A2K1IE01_PHYPA|nr:hypothetical protein PHYPA_029661 [Physcomitrium patens]